MAIGITSRICITRGQPPAKEAVAEMAATTA
jgi:hypothetical protein